MVEQGQNPLLILYLLSQQHIYLLTVDFIDFNPQNCFAYSLDLTNTFYKLVKRSVPLRCLGRVVGPGLSSFVLGFLLEMSFVM